MRVRLIRFVAAIAVFALGAPLTFAGVTYTVVSTTVQDKTEATMRVRTEVEGEHARIDILEGAVGPLHAGTWIVTNDGGKTMYLVDPQAKSYGVLDQAAMMGETSANVSKSVKVTTTEPKLERIVEEQGPPLLGLKTKHGKFKTNYSVTVKLVHGYTSTITSEDEVWWTDSVGDASLKRWSLEELLPPQPDERGLMSIERQKKVGFPLKRKIVTTAEEADGTSTIVTTTMEVTELKIVNVRTSEFEIPKSYKLVKLEMPQE